MAINLYSPGVAGSGTDRVVAASSPSSTLVVQSVTPSVSAGQSAPRPASNAGRKSSGFATVAVSPAEPTMDRPRSAQVSSTSRVATRRFS